MNPRNSTISQKREEKVGSIIAGYNSITFGLG